MPTNTPAMVALVRPLSERRNDVVAQVDAANRQLADEGSGWQFDLEEGATHPTVIPLVLLYQPPPNPEPRPQPASLLGFVSGNVSLDPLLEGAPAYKPHALTRGDFGRVPVSVLVDPPHRRPRAELPGGRRPVVALLDTAVDQHPWLGPPDPDLGGDAFWVDARRMGWQPGPRLPEPDPPTGEVQVLSGELGSQQGHGTFCAGLIRQVAPDAAVLAMHVIGDDGTVYGDHVINALGWLLDRNVLAESDVVCLPIGFQPVLPMDGIYLKWLGEVLGELVDRGVRVVASAGNDGDSDPVYPAAFAETEPPARQRSVSVGALNTDAKTRAYFSNHGTWVTAWEVGTSVVSAFPKVNGAARAALVSDDGRESADPDDFSGGFARWSGTSFAAAIRAGKQAQTAAVGHQVA